MTRALTTTIAALAALAWLLPSTETPAAAQETTAQDIHEALEKLRRADQADRPVSPRPEPDHEPAVRILRQVDRWGDPVPRTPAELDAFADQVAAMVLDHALPGDVRAHARLALMAAANPDLAGHGTPYPRAFDLLIEVYEGGYHHALYTIFLADSVRGPAYVRELFERSERPPLCQWRYDGDDGWLPQPHFVPLDYRPPPGCAGYNYRRDARPTPWCRAGEILFSDMVDEAWARTPGGMSPWFAGEPMPVPEGLPEHMDDWHRRCR